MKLAAIGLFLCGTVLAGCGNEISAYSCNGVPTTIVEQYSPFGAEPPPGSANFSSPFNGIFYPPTYDVKGVNYATLAEAENAVAANASCSPLPKPPSQKLGNYGYAGVALPLILGLVGSSSGTSTSGTTTP